MKKRILSILLSVLMLLTMVPQTIFFPSAAIVNSGSCGPNLTYTLDDTGTLTISGTGNMTNFYSFFDIPWRNSKESIKKLIIENGVTSIGYSAFDSFSALTTVNIPESVTSIGEDSFLRCTSLTSLIIPESVTTINNSAFLGCSSLTNINIPASVTFIGKFSFGQCSDLTSLNIPESVTTISDYAFSACSSLTTVNIPASVRSIGDNAFYGCSALNTVNIPASVRSIGDNAFFGCSALTSVNIPADSKLKYIGNLAFDGTKIMDSLPDGVNYLGNILFKYKGALPENSKIMVKYGTTQIYNSAFYDCTALTEVSIPASVTTIDDEAFKGCSALIDISVNPYNPAYSSENGVLFNKDKTHLIKYFKGKTGESYTIPSSVTSIGEEAFENCDNLTEVNIPASITSIGNNAFNNCSALTTVNISEDSKLTTIGDDAFSGCSLTGELYIPAGLTSIEGTALLNSLYETKNYTFVSVHKNNTVYSSENGVLFNKDKTVLIQYPAKKTDTSYTIPASVTTIEEFAFYDCADLTELNTPIDSKLIYIGYSAFNGTKLIENLPDGINYLGKVLYKYKGTMPENSVITVKNETKQIYESAFSSVPGSFSVILPESVLRIENRAFSGSGLKDINIPAPYTKLGSASLPADTIIKGCPGNTPAENYAKNNKLKFEAIQGKAEVLEAGTCGASLNYILDKMGKLTISGTGKMTDYNDNNKAPWYGRRRYIKSVVIENGVTNIGDFAFYSCSAIMSENIILSESITSIGASAFSGCNMLRKISIPVKVANIGKNAFSGCSCLISINVDINNKNFLSIDGVLFSKDKTKLIKFTRGNNNNEYIIPEGVIDIDSDAFAYHRGLERITIPSSVTYINDEVLKHCYSLTNITVDKNNKNYSSVNGVLFNKDKTILIKHPVDSINISYIIPSGVISISKDAFSGCRKIKYLSIPDSIKTIDSYAFSYCESLADVRYAGTIVQWKNIEIDTNNECLIYANILCKNIDPNHEHKFDKWTVKEESTCTENGIKSVMCSICGIEKTEEIKAKGHTEEILHAVEPTCTNTGLAEGKKCSVCDEILVSQEVVPATGHYFEKWTVTVPATCTESGSEKRVCSVCGAEETRVTPATGHDWGNWVITKEATYTEEGLKTKTCLKCGAEESCKIPVLKANNTIKDEDREAYIKYDDNILDKGTKLDVEDEFDGASFDLVNLEKGEFESEIYDITLTLNGKKVQPSGKVLVGIPLPDDYNPDKTYVYFVSENGLQKLDSYVKNGIIWFETDHFSSYAVINEVEKTPEVKPQCNHMCHSANPLMQFIWKIINFFNKLFKINQYCECGARHW